MAIKEKDQSNPIIVFIRGLPGSGKSYITNSLYKSLDTDKAIVLDPDTTDYEGQEYKAHSKALTAEGVDKKLHPYRFTRAKAFRAIEQNKTILWNQPFTNLDSFKKIVARMQEYAASHDKSLSILVVEVEIEDEVAKKRIADRKSSGGHGPSQKTFDRFIDDYRSFSDLGHKTVTVHGSDDVEKSVKTIQQALTSL